MTERRDDRRRGHDRPESRRTSSQDRQRDTSRHLERRRRRSRTRSRGHGRDGKREDDKRRNHRSRSRSRRRTRRTRSHSRSRSPISRSRKPLPSQADAYGGGPTKDQPAAERQQPNFAATGLLAKEANTVAGTTTILKYHEPKEARKPPASQQWRMFVFDGREAVDTIHLYLRSCWLVGRDRAVVDLELEARDASEQHAVVQFRHIPKRNEYGDSLDAVKPYLIDLESENGSWLNGEKIASSRFVELRDGDVIRFGKDQREYVIMLPPNEDPR